ncbi:MAG: hypothetical protein OXT07_03770 [bacterium]|nr:hypothetical protein [bacterium]
MLGEQLGWCGGLVRIPVAAAVLDGDIGWDGEPADGVKSPVDPG